MKVIFYTLYSFTTLKNPGYRNISVCEYERNWIGGVIESDFIL